MCGWGSTWFALWEFIIDGRGGAYTAYGTGNLRFIVLDKETYMTAWADPSIFFFHGYWALEPGQALVIQVR